LPDLLKPLLPQLTSFFHSSSFLDKSLEFPEYANKSFTVEVLGASGMESLECVEE
jgi:hypothetical protein